MSNCISNLRQELRTDAAVWCEILAAADLSKADELLSISFDESDKNNSSILNVMTTIKTKDTIKQVTLNGITLMAIKTSSSNSDAIVSTFLHAQKWLKECYDLYCTAGSSCSHDLI